MPKSASKVAISLDAELLLRAEHLRKSTGESRSALVSRALRRFLQAEDRAQKVRDYVQAYQRTPESIDEARAIGAISHASLKTLPWDDA